MSWEWKLDVVAGNRVIADDNWPDYFACKSDAGKEVSTNLNTMHINQQLND